MATSRSQGRRLPLPFPVRSQRYEVTFGAAADGGLEIAGWYQVNLGAEDGLQVGLDATQAEQAHVRRQVHEQVDVAVGPVLAAGQCPPAQCWELVGRIEDVARPRTGRMAGWILDWTAGFTSLPAGAAVLGSLRRGLSLITPIRLLRGG